MLHWIYPRYCELCHSPCRQDLCADCAARLPRVPVPICLYCGAPVNGGQDDPFSCAACRVHSRSYDFARSALVTDELSLQLVYRLKYHRANYLAAPLGRIMNELWQTTPELTAYADWCLVPVPAAAGHLFARGYNQAEELARAVARLRGLPVVNALERRPTGVDSQTRLSAAERKRNAAAAYAVGPAHALRRLGERAVLVDDVYTTGSTARACARLLHRAGVKQVAVLTLLRAMKRRV